jgi:hypothetical protein
MMEWISSVKDTEVEIAFILLYHIWLAQNAAQDNVQIEDLKVIARRAISSFGGVAHSSRLQGSKTPCAKGALAPT